MPSHTEEERRKRAKRVRDSDTNKRQRQEGQSFVRERESLAGQASGSKAATRKQVGAAGAQVEAQFQQRAQAQLVTDKAAAIEENKPAAQQALQAAGAFEENTPELRNLNTQLESDVPALTPSLAGLSQTVGPNSVLAIARRRGLFPKIFPEARTGEGSFPIPETPETLREAALREISVTAFNKGNTRAERFGTMVEAIPGVGNRARAWANGLIQDPSSNAEQVLANINRIREDASTGQEKVRNGLEDPGFGLDNARRMEEDIAKFEGRLKLNIESSPILQADTDQVNVISEKVFEAKEKVARYRQASSLGLTAQLTGAGRVIPTDEQIFFELKGGG